MPVDFAPDAIGFVPDSVSFTPDKIEEVPGGSLSGLSGSASLPSSPTPEANPVIPPGSVQETPSVPQPVPQGDSIKPATAWDMIQTHPVYRKLFGEDKALGHEAGLVQILTSTPLPFGLKGAPGKALMAYFIGSYVKDRPQALENLYKQYKSEDPGFAKDLLKEVVQGVMIGSGAHEVFKSGIESAPITGEALNKTLEEFQPTKGIANAGRIEETAAVHGDVQPQPIESPGEVPVAQSSRGVQPQAEGGTPGVPGETTPNAPVSNAEVTPPEQRLGISPNSPTLSRIADALIHPSETGEKVSTFLKGLAGESMPKTTAANRETGELGTRYASSRIASGPMSDVFTSGSLHGTGVDMNELGTALTEDNLRDVRQSFHNQASELLAKGDEEGAAAAVTAADNVHTLIGSKKSPFKTEAEYQDYLLKPEVQQAIEQHKQQWEETIDPMFKMAQGIDPDIQLPSRGLQTGARINLKAITDEEPGVRPVGASLTATFKKKSPFGVAAKGTGEAYETNYGEIIRNTFTRQLEIANKNAFDKSLVESGNAVIDKPGQQIEIGGESTVAFPLQRRMVIQNKDGTSKTFSQNQNLYVKKSLADEYRTASNVDRKHNIPVVTATMNMLNRAALAGLTDATVHVSNQLTALFNRPVSGSLLADSLLSATGRLDIPVTLGKAIFKAFQNNQSQLAELAEIGALREPHTGANPIGKFLAKTDQITRLVLDDTFKRLPVVNTETNRREYVNQIGQYNRRLQGPLTRFFRDTGFGPFVTAGRTFNALGVKMVSLSPGAEASSPLAAVALRANVLSKWIGAVTLIGTLNYLITKNKGGGVMGRPGVPIGSIDSGKDDDKGNPLSLPAMDLLGVGRGLRVTGIKGFAQAKYLGLENKTALDSAARDILNTSISPFAGPAIRFGTIAATGSPAAVDVGRISPVVPPGENQFKQNFLSAAKEANPVVKTILDRMDGKTLREAAATQLPRFTLTSGKPPEMVENYPEIVHKAQLSAYLDDVVHRARKMSDDKRDEYLNQVLDKLDNKEDREHALRTFKFRKVK